MKNKILLTAAGLACTLCSVSCIREGMMDEIYRPEGTEIIFAAANTYESEEAQTRVDFFGPDSLFFDTAASGEVEAETRTIFTNKGSSTVERIDWLNGDSMSIQYRRGSIQNGVYGVTKRAGGETDSSTKDIADVSHVRGTTLNWQGGSGAHKFYARYPEMENNNNLSSDTNGPMITGTIPDAQTVTWNSTQKKYLPDMNYCYMVGYKEISSSNPSSRVSLDFVPAVTMFEFNLKRATDGTTYVRSVTLSGSQIAGSFSFQLKGGSDPRSDWVKNVSAGSGGSITVSFSGGDKKMTKSDALNFTILASPISYTNPVLTLEMSTDGTNYFTKKLTLRGGSSNSSKTFAACKKHVITNSSVPNEDWEYTFEHTGTTMTVGSYSYQEIVRTESTTGDTGTAGFTSSKKDKGSGETSIAVSDFTYAYAPDVNGAPGTFSANIPSGLGLNSTTVSGSSTSTSKTIKGTWAANSGTSISTLTQLRGENMKSKGSVGSSSAPQDLALSTVASSGITFRSSGPTTANCYIVDRPGWYMFPLVYGNAIVSGNENTGAYTSTASVSWNPLHRYDGSGITSPYILDDINGGSNSNMDAICLWQDASGSTATATWDPTFISQVSIISKPSGATVNTYYIKFYVDPATVHPGNAVIALRKSETTTTIVWSWHIWLTDGVDTNGDNLGDGFPTFNWVAKSGVNASNDFLPLALGECQTGDVSGVTVCSERAGWVSVTQTASSKVLYFRIVQRGSTTGTPSITNVDSSPTYYQWGRKDPLLPRKGNTSTTNKDSTPYSGYTMNTTASTDATAAKSIQNPHVFYYQQYANAVYDWITASSPYNLWNMNQTSDDQDCTVKKTVYDPCPPGFSIPNRNAFTGTTYGGSHSSSTSDYNVSGSWSNGWTFYTGGWKTEGTFKATAHGWRFRNSGVLDSYGTLHGYMTAGGASGHQALGFTSTSGRVSPQLIHESRASGFPVLPAREH